MLLFFRNIPAPTRPNELYSYLAMGVSEDLMEQAKPVMKAEVMVIRDKRTNRLEHHGLVSVNSDEAGIYAIKNLDGLLFHGCAVLVRCYKQRDVNNDRRRNSLPVPQEFMEKRIQDRRRGDKVEIYVDFSNVFYPIEL
ncbi:RNA recognition motif domain-containing protein [Methylomonas albis]|jgi:hypothetical protein|uniref:RNA-binding protein n=1 Tax=Methylomonas albis TaxID=1854563 RepID=A0ABR9D2D5_9GAMM|nr:RNA-binding protein [Methylomonas albis]MBD9357257.1 RNA-binding protein [Methylomonas albis]